MDALSRAFGEAVRSRRAELGLSQESLGQIAGLDRTYVSGVERGVRNPTLSSMSRLAVALQVPISRLLSATEDQLVDPAASGP